MRRSLLLDYLLLLTTCSALDLRPRSDFSAPSVLSLKTQRRSDAPAPVHSSGQLRRRATKPVLVDLDNEEILYYVNMTIGTPAQRFTLHIDTGSSDLWCNTPNSRICRQASANCETGAYNANASSTSQYVNSNFRIRYVDGSGAQGDYVKDNVGIGGVSVKGLQFGVGYSSGNYDGILGIGYAANEAILSSQSGATNPQPYKNLPQLLVDQGYIKSNAYSLWLNDLDASQGELLFGGVNTEKYHGTLQTLPIQRSSRDNTIREFNIALTGMGLSVNNRNSTFSTQSLPVAVLLDSGSTLSYLPDDIANALVAEVGATYSRRLRANLVPCSLARNTSLLTFTFSSITIAVPFNELVIDPGTNVDGSPLTFADGTLACYFGVVGSGSNPDILGDTFLRSAYVVYDLDNNQISLAATNFNASNDNILEIGTGSKAVPDATGVQNPATAVASATGGARLGLPSGATGTQSGGVVTVTRAGDAMRTQAPIAMAGAMAMGALWAL